MGVFTKLKISQPFSGRSRVAGSRALWCARLGNFATAWVRGCPASHPQPPAASAEPPARAAGRTAAAAAAAGRAAERRSGAARPPPSDKRRHQSRSGSGEGPVLGGRGPTRRARGAEFSPQAPPAGGIWLPPCRDAPEVPAAPAPAAPEPKLLERTPRQFQPLGWHIPPLGGFHRWLLHRNLLCLAVRAPQRLVPAADFSRWSHQQTPRPFFWFPGPRKASEA